MGNLVDELYENKLIILNRLEDMFESIGKE